VQQHAAAGTAGDADASKLLQITIATAFAKGHLRDTRLPLVEARCGTCGKQRDERHKVQTEPGLLTTHHPTAPALKVCCVALEWFDCATVCCLHARMYLGACSSESSSVSSSSY